MGMQFKASIKKSENKEDHYELSIKTYKQSLEGRFERSEIRHLIEILDNEINVGQ